MSKRETLTARRTYTEIAAFIEQGNPAKADEYLSTVNDVFWSMPDFVTYKRASERLPEAVREMPVRGFPGYTLRIMRYSDGVTYLLSCHRPGLPDELKDRITGDGLSEV